MNYRHAFHAGGISDVVKHAVVAAILNYLKRKPAPMFVLDAHAGAGRYDLTSVEAAKTGEFRDGIARLIDDRAAPKELQSYLATVRALQDGPSLHWYPGSPVLIRSLLRRGDRLFAVELHPEDYATLDREFARDRQVRTFNLDGYAALGSFLPPSERRGFVLIDPPFEVTDEFPRMVKALQIGLRHWATGTFALWYPIKYPEEIAAFHRAVAEEPRVGPALAIEFEVQRPDGLSLAGTGMVVINPPFVLAEAMRAVLPYLAERLRQGRRPEWRVIALKDEEPSVRETGAA